MQIVVLGAGTVGRNIAAMLAQERHEVTVVDRNPELIQRINDELDVRGLVGEAAPQSSVLSPGRSGGGRHLFGSDRLG